MVLADTNNDDDIILQWSLSLEVVNDNVYNRNRLRKHDIGKCQRHFFDFGVLISTVFNVDLTTKLHRLMRHIDSQLLKLGCLRHGSSEEKEMKHKTFKYLYNNSNQNLECIAPQFLTTWVHSSSVADDSFNAT